jgi:histidine ammonia-lyase
VAVIITGRGLFVFGGLAMIAIDGRTLTPQAVEAVARGAPAALSNAARSRVERSQAMVDEIIWARRPVYGVSTGVGNLCTVAIGADQVELLQRNILRSHAAGVGAQDVTL